MKHPLSVLRIGENPIINVKVVTISCTKLKFMHFCFCVCKFGCYGNSLCSLKIFVSIFEFADPKNPTIHAGIVSISCTELKSVQFWFIFAQFWLPWQLAPLKIQVVYLNSPTLYIPYHTCEKFLDFLHRIEICAILVYFRLNLVAMATLMAPLKFQRAYLNSTTPKTYYSYVKVLDFLRRTEIGAIFVYFCPNLVAMATPLAPLKFQRAYLNSTTPKTYYSCVKVLDFLRRTEIGAIFVYFCPNFVAMATLLAPLKFQIAYLILQTPKTLLFV